MLQIRDICKQYKTGDYVQTALDHVSLDLRDNEFVAILGPSGSGKTTLLNIIGGLDRYDSGDLIIGGVSTKKYKDRDWDAYRNHTIGFIFQSYNLIQHQTVLANVELALTLSGVSRAERKKRALDALEKVGLKEQAHKKPNQMSGGQMQRVAIARALVNDPEIILADEPTGALDSETSIQVMDLLKEVAADRLVVMVTHNPELAEQYATRIIRVKDGHIIDDTHPVEAGEIEFREEKQKRTRLGFTTALGLSLNNLMTKKGRTILTAFAGAIGIIGIAAILSLSTGVNKYIDDKEKEMLGAYPISLEKQTFDLSSMMNIAEAQTTKADENQAASGKVYSKNVVADTVKTTASMLKENDLGKFKTYFDAHMDEVKDYISTIEYGYSITPQIYRKGEKMIKVSPATLEVSGFESTYASSYGGMSGLTSSVWTQLPNSEELRNDKYELLEGEWPKEKDEAAIVVTSDNEVADYTLYTLGVMDMNAMDSLMKAVEKGETYEDPQQSFELKDMIGLEFRAFAPADFYSRSSENEKVWLNKEDDQEFLESIYDDGLPVKIVGVLRVTAKTGAQSGVAYTGALTEYLMDKTAESEIVKEQLASEEVNVLTGEAFDKGDEDAKDTDDSESEKKDTSAGVTLKGHSQSGVAFEETAYYANVVSGEQAEKMNTAVSLGVMEKLSAVDTDAGEVPGSGDAVQSGEQGEGGNDEGGSAEPGQSGSSEGGNGGSEDPGKDDTPGELDPNKEYTVTFVDHEGKVLQEQKLKMGEKVTPPEAPQRNSSTTAMYVFLGWQPEGSQMFFPADQIPPVTGDVTYHPFYYEYLVENQGNLTIADLIKASGIDVKELIAASGLTFEDIMAATGMSYDDLLAAAGVDKDAIMQEIMSGYQFDINDYLNEQAIDWEAILAEQGYDLSQYGDFNLSKDQLATLLAQYSGGTPNTYKSVLEKLGYCTKEQPESIDIYPNNIEGKDKIGELIERYNEQVSEEADKVTYNDIIGVISSSITSIINTISLILIAFVAISLVVSSIMIAIITYISVLERTKEIGVLRALGASKKDVSKIFNAETFIEGLVSGLFGIATTLVLCIPANIIVKKLKDVDQIAVLPMKYAIILIIISVVLTLLAGFVPARMAAKKDPVAALRSE